jgi:hypothetical protein
MIELRKIFGVFRWLCLIVAVATTLLLYVGPNGLDAELIKQVRTGAVVVSAITALPIVISMWIGFGQTVIGINNKPKMPTELPNWINRLLLWEAGFWRCAFQFLRRKGNK